MMHADTIIFQTRIVSMIANTESWLDKPKRYQAHIYIYMYIYIYVHIYIYGQNDSLTLDTLWVSIGFRGVGFRDQGLRVQGLGLKV